MNEKLRTCRARSWGMLVAFALLLGPSQTSQAEGRRFRFGEENVPGWALMSSAERAAHHQTLMSLRTLQECRDYMESHRAEMEARAKERGVVLRLPRFDVCDEMRRRGFVE